jgi:hypothetical protein
MFYFHHYQLHNIIPTHLIVLIFKYIKNRTLNLSQEQVIGIEPTLFQLGRLAHHHLCVTCVLQMGLMFSIITSICVERVVGLEPTTSTLAK